MRQSHRCDAHHTRSQVLEHDLLRYTDNKQGTDGIKQSEALPQCAAQPRKLCGKAVCQGTLRMSSVSCRPLPTM